MLPIVQQCLQRHRHWLLHHGAVVLQEPPAQGVKLRRYPLLQERVALRLHTELQLGDEVVVHQGFSCLHTLEGKQEVMLVLVTLLSTFEK